MRSLRPVFWLLPFALLLVGGVAWSARPKSRLSDEARGQQLYDRHCVQCHGATTAGDGATAAVLVVKVPDLRGKLSEANRDEMADVVLAGRGVMPGFESSFDKYDARRALRHMEKVAREAQGKGPAPVGQPAEKADDSDAVEAGEPGPGPEGQ